MNSLEQENINLKRKLQLIVSKAERNRDILMTFQEYELRLLACEQLSDLLDLILIGLKEYFRLDAVNLILFDPDQAAQQLMGSYSPPQPAMLRFTEAHDTLSRLYGSGLKPVLSLPKETLRNFAFPEQEQIKSYALLPLIHKNALIGSIHLGSNDPQRYGDDVATEYVTHLAAVLSNSLTNSISRGKMRLNNVTDLETGVTNRSAFDNELLKELSRANRSHYPLSFLFIRLDHFDQFKHNFGASAGGRLLRIAVDHIQKQLRLTDLIARYAEGQFAVLLPTCLSNRASQLADTIRHQLSNQNFSPTPGSPFELTLSIGVSTCPPQKNQIDNFQEVAKRLTSCAEKAVDQARQQGGDKVIYIPFNNPEIEVGGEERRPGKLEQIGVARASLE
jgi:diguanylate cyclase (GGDEF)-like protein